MPRTPTTSPAWLHDARAVDTVVAALLDTADRDEAEARKAGSQRRYAASIRQLRHYAHTLADLGTPNALATAPDELPAAQPSTAVLHELAERAS